MDVQGKGVVVTGAGHGIGRAIAVRMAAEGARVVVNDLDAEAVGAVAEEIGGHPVPGDAATEAGVSTLLYAARRHLGAIDIYFANAGIDLGDRADCFCVEVVDHDAGSFGGYPDRDGASDPVPSPGDDDTFALHVHVLSLIHISE